MRTHEGRAARKTERHLQSKRGKYGVSGIPIRWVRNDVLGGHMHLCRCRTRRRGSSHEEQCRERSPVSTSPQELCRIEGTQDTVTLYL